MIVEGRSGSRFKDASSTYYTNPSCVVSPTFQFMGPNVHPT